TTAAALERFTVNFTITNLPYTSDLENPDSARFRSTQRVMKTLLNRLLKESSIGPVFQGCETTAFRYGSTKNRDDTGVDAMCSCRDEPSDPKFNRTTIYRELSKMTDGITKLGHYSLNSQSLYVNG
ncbi:MUC16 protein, partial [Pteruthius melanotis]|nr:MUC16 protein [Pteruthius melanotis]